MAKDYYKALGVEKKAPPDEIKAAFRRLAMEHHPDRGGNPEKFKEINEAYQVLSDSGKRAQYDQFGSDFSAQGGPRQWSGQNSGGPFGGSGFRWEDFSNNADFGNLGDIFGDFFSGSEEPRGRRGRRTKRGRDIQVDLTIDFLESVFGAEKELSLYKDVVCSVCSGEGVARGSKKITCKTCGGSGKVVEQRRILFGNFQTVTSCPDCGGAGSRAEKKCSECGGAGAIKGEETLVLKIPAGISDGETLRLSGKGEAGASGAGFGDLYVLIRVKSDKRFKREGFNILSEKEITFGQAALGATVDLETVNGKVELKIPAGIQSGEIIRLRDKGVLHLGGSGRGDHLVDIIVKTPKKLSKKARRLMEELEGEWT